MLYSPTFIQIISSIIKLKEMSFIPNVCSMTGSTLSFPVVSKKSGHVFQKQPILKHLSTFPYCPITNQPLEVSDLVEVVGPNEQSSQITNKPSQAVNMYMDKLQNEYDSLILELHNLKKGLKEAKQELVHCKYRNEAGERIIGKLLKEKEESEKEMLELESKLRSMKK